MLAHSRGWSRVAQSKSSSLRRLFPAPAETLGDNGDTARQGCASSVDPIKRGFVSVVSCAREQFARSFFLFSHSTITCSLIEIRRQRRQNSSSHPLGKSGSTAFRPSLNQCAAVDAKAPGRLDRMHNPRQVARCARCRGRNASAPGKGTGGRTVRTLTSGLAASMAGCRDRRTPRRSDPAAAAGSGHGGVTL